MDCSRGLSLCREARGFCVASFSISRQSTPSNCCEIVWSNFVLVYQRELRGPVGGLGVTSDILSRPTGEWSPEVI